MLKKQWLKSLGLVGGALVAAICLAGAAAASNAIVQKNCAKCHPAFSKMDNVVAGNLESRSMKAKSLNVKVGEKFHIIKFSKDTTVKNVPAIKKMKKPLPVMVSYKVVGHDLVATAIVAKPVIKVAKNQLVDVKGMIAAVKSGKAAIVDSRPPALYQGGHIPGAIMMPFPKMPQIMGKLPTDKNALIIFYCEGFR